MSGHAELFTLHILPVDCGRLRGTILAPEVWPLIGLANDDLDWICIRIRERGHELALGNFNRLMSDR
jgi:hypothetical protein